MLCSGNGRALDDHRGRTPQWRRRVRASLLRGPGTDRLRALRLGTPPVSPPRAAPDRLHRLRPAGRPHTRGDRRRARQAPRGSCADAPRLVPALRGWGYGSTPGSPSSSGSRRGSRSASGAAASRLTAVSSPIPATAPPGWSGAPRIGSGSTARRRAGTAHALRSLARAGRSAYGHACRVRRRRPGMAVAPEHHDPDPDRARAQPDQVEPQSATAARDDTVASAAYADRTPAGSEIVMIPPPVHPLGAIAP